MRRKIRKGMAINSLLVMTGALLFAGLIGVLYTESPLGEALMQGANLAQDDVDYTIEVENKQQLSDIAMFVYQRGSDQGCKEANKIDGGSVYEQNNNNPDNNNNPGIDKWRFGNPNQKGYPGLKDSYLGRYPDCYGTSDSIAGGPAAIGPDEHGEDMEGVYGREHFEIVGEKPIKLEAGDKNNPRFEAEAEFQRDRGDVWLEHAFMLPSKGTFNEEVKTNCIEVGGTKSNFAMYFEPEPSDDRALSWMGDEFDKSPYCSPIAVKPWAAEMGGNDNPSGVTLCPGDKGYIQMNKAADGDSPKNDGEAGEDLGEADKYGYIQITELGEDCSSFNLDENLDVSTPSHRFNRNSYSDDEILIGTTVTNNNNVPVNLKMIIWDENGNKRGGMSAEWSVGAGDTKEKEVSSAWNNQISGRHFDGYDSDDSETLDTAYEVAIGVAPENSNSYVRVGKWETPGRLVSACTKSGMYGCDFGPPISAPDQYYDGDEETIKACFTYSEGDCPDRCSVENGECLSSINLDPDVSDIDVEKDKDAYCAKIDLSDEKGESECKSADQCNWNEEGSYAACTHYECSEFGAEDCESNLKECTWTGGEDDSSGECVFRPSEYG